MKGKVSVSITHRKLLIIDRCLSEIPEFIEKEGKKVHGQYCENWGIQRGDSCTDAAWR